MRWQLDFKCHPERSEGSAVRSSWLDRPRGPRARSLVASLLGMTDPLTRCWAPARLNEEIAMTPTPSRSAGAAAASCCGSTASAADVSPPTDTTATASACCGDPTPNPATGACCSEPAATCGCQSPNAVASGAGRHTVATKAEPGRLPVAVIGAGPIGLAAAAHLIEKGETPVIFEAGDRKSTRLNSSHL